MCVCICVYELLSLTSEQNVGFEPRAEANTGLVAGDEQDEGYNTNQVTLITKFNFPPPHAGGVSHCLVCSPPRVQIYSMAR